MKIISEKFQKELDFYNKVENFWVHKNINILFFTVSKDVNGIKKFKDNSQNILRERTLVSKNTCSLGKNYSLKVLIC